MTPRSTRTASAPPTPSPSTPRDGVDHRHLGRRPGAHDPRRWSTPRPSRATSPGPATSSRCAPSTAACCAAPGHTEAAVDLARLAGLDPAGADLRDRQRRRLDDARRRSCGVFADEHGLAMISIADLIDLPRGARDARRAGRRDPAADPARRVPGRRLPQHASTASSTWPWCGRDRHRRRDVLVRVHSECLTGDVLGSLRPIGNCRRCPSTGPN